MKKIVSFQHILNCFDEANSSHREYKQFPHPESIIHILPEQKSDYHLQSLLSAGPFFATAPEPIAGIALERQDPPHNCRSQTL
jgi:hypothetical protein